MVEQRHHHDNALGLALLARLDRLADRADTSNAARYVADEFDQFVEIAAAGGEGAADFVASRCALGWRAHEETQVLRRAENFAATGDGLPEGDEPEESAAVESLRALFAMATEEDDEDEDDDDENEPDQDEAGEDEPEAVDDAECKADEEDEEDQDAEYDLSGTTLEEFMSDVLAGPYGAALQNDDDEHDDDDEGRASSAGSPCEGGLPRMSPEEFVDTVLGPAMRWLREEAEGEKARLDRDALYAAGPATVGSDGSWRPAQ